jgi:two-component system cell cycle sensor histidine kinase/response regulator CckA
LVEDEAPLRSVAQQTLEAFGYRVLSAVDGAEAVAVYARHQDEIDAVITDMTMPIMDGAATIEVLTRINRDVRIIAASGIGEYSRVDSPNVRQFLAKPYTTEAILIAVVEALQT